MVWIPLSEDLALNTICRRKVTLKKPHPKCNTCILSHFESTHVGLSIFIRRSYPKCNTCTDAPSSSLCDPKRDQRVGFAELVRNLVPLPASNTKRGRGVVLEASGLDQEKIKLFDHKSASKTNTSWLEVILHAFGVGTNHGLTRTHMTHHGPDSGEATTFPLIVFSAALRRGYIQMNLQFITWNNYLKQ